MPCKCAYMSRVHANTWQHVTALIIGIFLGGARSVCSLQEAGAEGFFPLSDRARQFSFSLGWGVRRRQPALPAGASQLLPSPGVPETDHPVQALPSYFQTGWGLFVSLVLREICAINFISRTAIRGKPCRWESSYNCQKDTSWKEVSWLAEPHRAELRN